MTATLEIDLLRTLLSVSESGSFTRAARQVNRSQSAVSMQMKRLEGLIGKPVFRREGRQMVLTDDGKALVTHGRRILAAHQEALAHFTERELTGTVRLGTPDDYAAAFLPGLLSRFAATYPRVHVDVRCEPSPSLKRLLEDGQLDLSILSCDAGKEEGPLLRREQVIWASSPEHDVHQREPLPLALFKPPCIFYDWAVRALDSIGRSHRIAYTSANLSAIHAAVSSGLAVTAIAESSNVKALRRLGPDDGFPSLPMISITLVRLSHSGSEASALLADHIVRSFQHGRA